MQVEKNISFLIEQQFPAIYRESGRELIAIVEEYYKWLETDENQSVYNARRLFEYRDIDTTLSKMLIFFKNKFLSELPLDEETTRFFVKNIMSFYRRRGTSEGLKLFFKLFFQENIEIYYPAKDIFKPSASEWKVNPYIQLFPNSGRFYSSGLDRTFTYEDLSGRTISGSVSKASGIVDKINIRVLNNTITPILYINKMKGKFIGYDDVITKIDGVLVSFGRVFGSVDAIIIDEDFNGTTGNKVGDILTISSTQGFDAEAIITSVNDTFTGQISYRVVDGGFGYTLENTKLLVSNQSIKYTVNSGIENSDFIPLERVEDQFGNQATVIGYDENFVGFKLDANNEFSNTSSISTLDRDSNITFDASDIFAITPKNDSSPGNLYPETANTSDVILAELENSANVSLITDVIGNFANVSLDATNYNDPPALVAMSGNTDPVTIDTTLENAFDLTPFEIGSIKSFNNIDPGFDYVNDVFVVVQDPVMNAFDRYPQIITLNEINAAISIGDTVSQNGVQGQVLDIVNKSITVLPYSYYGFNSGDDLTYKNNDYNIAAIETDYSRNKYGLNAIVDPDTQFATGRVLTVDVINSGFGYRDNQIVDLLDLNGNVAARGTLQSKGTGITGGFWSSLDSHLNGYVTTNGSTRYFESGKYVQDSNFYQEYSYQIISSVNQSEYEELLKELVHVSGTKNFSRFKLEKYLNRSRNIRYIPKFLDPEEVDP